MKAIETVYNGYRFRSRLEARWAVFFDEMGINYRYECEGYEWKNDDDVLRRYLPDFEIDGVRLCSFTEYLNDTHDYYDLCIEVKPRGFDWTSNRDEWRGVIDDPKKLFALFAGDPFDCSIKIITTGDALSQSTIDRNMTFKRFRSGQFIMYCHNPPFMNNGSPALITFLNCSDSIDELDENNQYSAMNDFYLVESSDAEDAARKARQARFEYGEVISP